MSDNSDSDNSAKFQAFDFIRSKIPYSPVLQELLRNGNAKCVYRRKRKRQMRLATKKRYRDQVEADMSEMSSMSESEIHAVMEEQARKKKEDQRKFLEYSSKTQGEME